MKIGIILIFNGLGLRKIFFFLVWDLGKKILNENNGNIYGLWAYLMGILCETHSECLELCSLPEYK